MRIQTNYVRRFHLNVDPEARVLDCFRVEVLMQKLVVCQGNRQNVTLNQLWLEMLQTVESFQKSYHTHEHWKHYGIHNPLDLQPFAIVTACEEQREHVKSQINVHMACGGQEPCEADSDGAAMARVRHLTDAWSGLEWLGQ